jgi:hypothetical protein
MADLKHSLLTGIFISVSYVASVLVVRKKAELSAYG